MSANPLQHLPQFTLNLRWLASQVSPIPSAWAGLVARRCTPIISVYRATALLEGEEPNAEESAVVVDAFAVERDTVFAAPLYGAPPDTILNLNLRFLINAVPKGGERAALAASLGVTPSTLSRWGHGRVRPERKNLRALLHHFGEDEQIDLDTTPLFLATHPVGEVRKRAWLVQQIMALPTPELIQVFPAAERIFSFRESHKA